MWTAKTTVLSDRVCKISIHNNESILTYADVISHWQENTEFRSFYFNVLQEAPFEAFFWEHPPVTKTTINQAYEFVLVNSPQLARVTADSNPFREKFKADSLEQSVIVFENLGRDATLIVPHPVNPKSDYAHFAPFLHNAPQSQIHELFVALANSLSKRINDQPTWVSTSGLGVYWLHVRLDSRPKYYSYQAYRQYSG